MRTQTIVILGYGQRGKIYADYALRNPTEFKVVAIVETDKARQDLASSRHDCPIFTDYKDFLQANIPLLFLPK